ncbi:MAG TPA: hypothetical protein VEU08_11075, partial [Vicinamibacterales bacterium]|nr:hypothetical protein [Vicinamibacterales bacterium]
FGLCLVCAPAGAQTLPSEPITVADGRVTIGGDVAASVGSSDPGFFNYTDYEYSALRMLRIDISAAVNAGEHVAVLGQVRMDMAIDDVRSAGVEPYALYLRYRPWTSQDVAVEIGRIPPAFGAFARRSYGSDNPLIGYPLGYQYLTTLRADSLPANADELLRKRGRGWLDTFSIGDPTLKRGVPLVSAFNWDTGVQVHAGTDVVKGTFAVTTGTLSNPRLSDDNDGRQFAGRAELHPLPGLIVGTSLARGPFVSSNAVRAAVAKGARDGDFTQTAWGTDVEYSSGYFLGRFESIWSRWRIPVIDPVAADLPLDAVSTSFEGRYKLMPGLYVATRIDRLVFSDVVGTTQTLPWDAPAGRVEVGAGYSIQRNLLLKASVQRNSRNGGPLKQAETLGAVQLVFWF